MAFGSLIAPYVDAPFTALGTDGFGRSNTRSALRSFFEVDSSRITVAALAAEGQVSREKVSEAIASYGLETEADAPWSRRRNARFVREHGSRRLVISRSAGRHACRREHAALGSVRQNRVPSLGDRRRVIVLRKATMAGHGIHLTGRKPWSFARIPFAHA